VATQLVASRVVLCSIELVCDLDSGQEPTDLTKTQHATRLHHKIKYIHFLPYPSGFTMHCYISSQLITYHVYFI
jgi:hypothetical protein